MLKLSDTRQDATHINKWTWQWTACPRRHLSRYSRSLEEIGLNPVDLAIWDPQTQVCSGGNLTLLTIEARDRAGVSRTVASSQRKIQ